MADLFDSVFHKEIAFRFSGKKDYIDTHQIIAGFFATKGMMDRAEVKDFSLTLRKPIKNNCVFLPAELASQDASVVDVSFWWREVLFQGKLVPIQSLALEREPEKFEKMNLCFDGKFSIQVVFGEVSNQYVLTIMHAGKLLVDYLFNSREPRVVKVDRCRFPVNLRSVWVECEPGMRLGCFARLFIFDQDRKSMGMVVVKV